MSTQSTVTQSSAIECDVEVTFKDVCWDLTVTTVPAPPISWNTVTLYEANPVTAITPMNLAWGDVCNGFTYAFTYISGPMSLPIDISTVFIE